MKVTEKLNKGRPTLSFEFFPPKTPEQEAHLYEVLGRLKRYQPDFTSVTYGALGTTSEKTFRWVKEIKNQFNIEPVAHLTCIAATRGSILSQLNELEGMGVQNILALRGDPPEGQMDFSPPPNGFQYAKDLAAFIKENKPDFCLGVAGFPEGHPRSPSLVKDIEYLKEKIEAGGEYVITQLFFDNQYYFDFVDRCRKAGINVPIIPGVMPIVSLKQIKKMTKVCGATIPAGLLAKIEENEKFGIDYAIVQCRELLEHGVPGIHFFVMNQAGPISRILDNLKIFFKK